MVVSAGASVVLPLTACIANRATPALRDGERPSSNVASSPAARSTTPAASHPNDASPAPTTTASYSATASPASKESSEPLSCERLVAKVGRNHGHAFPIAARDVLDGVTKTFDLRGDSDHTHTVELSTTELAALGRGEFVRKQTERGGANAHRHRVLLRCEPLVLPPEMVSACDVVVAGKDDHEFVIPESHVREGVARDYDIQGVAGHTHVLTVTAADFQRIAAGQQLDLKSGQGLGHFHHVYIRYRNT